VSVATAAHSSGPAPSRVPRAEAVARDLEIEILGDGLAPGERLGTKDDLRQRFGVAVATVNEAVRLLEMRGLIEARPGPGGGVFVARSSVRVALKRSGLQATWGAARVSDCLVVRNALEPVVCHDAASYHGEDDVSAMHRILAEMDRDATDQRAYLEHNWALHRRIAKLCRNAPLHSIYLTLLDFLEDGLDAADLRDFDGRADVDVHRELVAAIASGPGDRLEAAIAAHADVSAIQRTRRVAGRSRPSAAR
jgi:GntR family transcriptional regulator, transcriptional repressor for pyruvate dehydrogenase complex